MDGIAKRHGVCPRAWQEPRDRVNVQAGKKRIPVQKRPIRPVRKGAGEALPLLVEAWDVGNGAGKVRADCVQFCLSGVKGRDGVAIRGIAFKAFCQSVRKGVEVT